MHPIVTFTVLSTILCGCASIVNETTHPIKIETKTVEGETIKGARCTLSNNYGKAHFLSGETTSVRRSGEDLDINCQYPSKPDANGRIISRANQGMAGNILFGGGVGAIIDHNKGTAYTYPSWIQLIYGKTLVFDRDHEQEGQPVLGKDIDQK
ncbi:MAG: hypothetical protein ACRYGR_02275 [Janthinobacterium lividum]